MVNFGVPIREEGCTTKEGILGRLGKKEELCGFEVDKEGALTPGSKSPHLEGIVFP
jgi:hypothetical protein